MMRQIVALLAASLVFWPMRWASASYCGLPVALANGRIATVGMSKRATGVGPEDVTTAAILPADKYHAAAAAPATTSSAASAATDWNEPALRRRLRLGRGGGLA